MILTSDMIDVVCGVPYCGNMLGRAKSDSVFETKCNRCYALVLFEHGHVRVTRPPRRRRYADGRWFTARKGG